MENNQTVQPVRKADYYSVIRNNLKKQYSTLEKQEINTLTREVIFAPRNYTTEIKDTPVQISAVRENLANAIANNTETKQIKYSLEADLADMIERSNCETSSMNEYYRWISETAEILKNTSDGELSNDDVSERNDFIIMSTERETEILICLALYESANLPKNKDKVNLLKFKLARLREMRSIVKNTPRMITGKKNDELIKIKNDYNYCLSLLKEKEIISYNVNDILNVNINHISNEDLEDDFSYISFLQNEILRMMHLAEKSETENQHSENNEEKSSENTLNLNLSSVRETEGR